MDKDRKTEVKKDAVRRESVSPTSPVIPTSSASPEAAKDVPTTEDKKKRKERRKSSLMTSGALTYSAIKDISMKETTDGRKGKKSAKQSGSHASLEAAKETSTKEAKKKGKERRKYSMKDSAPVFSGIKEVSAGETTKTKKRKGKTSRKQSAAATSLEAAKKASGQTKEENTRRDELPGELFRSDARPVDTAVNQKATDAATKEKVAPVISGDQRETSQIAPTSDLPEEGNRKGSKVSIEVAAASKNANSEKLAETGGLRHEGHVKKVTKNDKASLMHQTTEGEKPTGHLEKGMTDDRHGPPKSSLGKAENFAGPEKIPKKSVLKKTKGQVCEGGKAIDYLAEGRDLASEGVLQSCLKNSKTAAALRQGAEPAKDDEEEEEAKAAWRAMMRRKDSIAVHRVTQKKHERQGLVAEEEPQVLQLGKHRPSPVHKTETRPVAEGEPVVVQLAKQGLSPDQTSEHWPEKANKPAALLPQCAAFARGGDEKRRRRDGR
ncbi:hypothetical protein HPB51_026395 [Rhipicephalus microplus]|uniref:Uncharacterized protein n=1 Tax=Rhipicephalus microplus TaxID=6941 RepID=A0A9J6D363_RHIMP|nr:hypothetical protein HPB51_026395 [Rhipicephalus microplus]